MKNDDLRRRFEALKKADSRREIPGFRAMRARAMQVRAMNPAVEKTALPGWCTLAGGGAVAVVTVVLMSAPVQDGGDGLQKLPPLFGESVGELEFLETAPSVDREWLGAMGSDRLLPEKEIKVL